MFPAAMNQQSIAPITLNTSGKSSASTSVPNSTSSKETILKSFTLPTFDLTDADNVMSINELLLPPGRNTRPKK